MSFLLRCIVCLGVLYAAILRHDGYLVEPPHLPDPARSVEFAPPWQAGTTIAALAGPQAAARITAYCRRDTAVCLAGAAALVGPDAVGHGGPQRNRRGPLVVRGP